VNHVPTMETVCAKLGRKGALFASDEVKVLVDEISRLHERLEKVRLEGQKRELALEMQVGNLQRELAMFYKCTYMGDGPAHNHVYEVDAHGDPSSRSHPVYHKREVNEPETQEECTATWYFEVEDQMDHCVLPAGHGGPHLFETTKDDHA